MRLPRQEPTGILCIMLIRRPRDRRRLIAKAHQMIGDDLLIRRLTKAVAETCLWDTQLEDRTWRPGDYRFMTLAVSQDEGQSFVQLWSEPHDVVVFEVASGRYAALGPDTASPQRRAAVLRKLGLALPKRGVGNWTREVWVPDQTACRALASDMLRVLREVFLYAFDHDLELIMVHATRLAADEVLYFTRIDRIAQQLRDVGAEVLRVDTGNGWLEAQSAEGVPFRAILSRAVATPETDTFAVLDLTADLSVPAAELQSVQAQFCASASVMLVLDAREGKGRLAARQGLGGGITPRALKDFTCEFLSVAAAIRARNPDQAG